MDRIRNGTTSTDIDGRTIITRTFDAPRELVYSAWTNADLVRQWWGPQHFTNPVCEVDATEGGAIVIHMQAPDGSLHPMDGSFETIDAPHRLVFTTRGLRGEDGQPNLEVRTTATFTEADGSTTITLLFDVLTATDVAAGALGGMREGWNQSLDKLTDHLANVDAAHAEIDSNCDVSARTIAVTRVIGAPRALVFHAFTDPENIHRWWGPDGFTTTTQAIAIHPGGAWRFIMHGPDGTDYDNHIIYTAIDPTERLTYTHVEAADGTTPVFHSTITFADEDGGGRTRVTMSVLLPTQAIRDQVAGYAIPGGEQNLTRLDAYLTQQAAT